MCLPALRARALLAWSFVLCLLRTPSDLPPSRPNGDLLAFDGFFDADTFIVVCLSLTYLIM
jgi:hypothetical protein